MCGRFALAPYEDLAGRYSIPGLPQPEPRYNISPAQDVLCVLPDGIHENMFWGVRPYGRSLINARTETVKEKAMFARLVEDSRCLVPATGFYEWDSKKHPHLFRLNGGEVFSMAALYTDRREVIILTRESQAPVSEVHSRMPCVITKEKESEWFNSSVDDALKSIGEGPPLERLAVGQAVNDVKNEGPRLIEPVDTLDSF